MTKLQIINVGQGDCFILRPESCDYDGDIFIIDLGDGYTDYTRCINEADEKLHIILSHSDKDHIGGLKYLFFNNMFERVESLTVPYYHNEIVLIAQAILNVKGIEKIEYTNDFINYLKSIVASQEAIKTIKKHRGKPCVKFAYENADVYCGHFSFYNPPLKFNRMPDLLNDETIERISEIFSSDYRNQIQLYFQSYHRGFNNYSDSPDINSIFISEEENFEEGNNHNKVNFVMNYFNRNYETILNFANKPSVKLLKTLVADFKLTSNQTSLVFKYKNQNDFLFTGDADIKMLNRIIKNGHNISCDILKVPHHGSKKSLNSRILNKINPETAIISHNNGRFGRCKDSHPHKEVIELLQHKRVKIIVTNDVIKNGCVEIGKPFALRSYIELP